MLLANEQRVPAGGRFEHVIAATTQDRARQAADLLVVLDEQHRLRTSHHRGVYLEPFRGSPGAVGAWQVNLERRAASDLAVDPDTASALFDDAEHGGQPKARPLALIL